MIEKIKTDLVRRTDPETKESYWERVSVTVKKPEEIDRMNAVLDILRGSITPEEVRELKAQLRQAKKEAEVEKLRAEAYDTMITLAEQTFNIPVRKKSGTKR